jgi:hypothetical protein
MKIRVGCRGHCSTTPVFRQLIRMRNPAVDGGFFVPTGRWSTCGVTLARRVIGCVTARRAFEIGCKFPPLVSKPLKVRPPSLQSWHTIARCGRLPRNGSMDHVEG